MDTNILFILNCRPSGEQDKERCICSADGKNPVSGVAAALPNRRKNTERSDFLNGESETRKGWQENQNELLQDQ